MALIDKDDKRYPPDSPQRTGLFFGNKEIIVGKRPGRPPKRIRNPENGWFSQEKKVEACTLYAALGDLSQVSELTEVPVSFLRAWKQEGWWHDIMGQVTTEQDEHIVAQMHYTLNQSLEQLTDRLEHGDFILDKKTGQMVRQPVSAASLNKIITSLTDKRQLIQGKPTARTERVSATERLEKLAEQFVKFSKAREISEEPVE